MTGNRNPVGDFHAERPADLISRSGARDVFPIGSAQIALLIFTDQSRHSYQFFFLFIYQSNISKHLMMMDALALRQHDGGKKINKGKMSLAVCKECFVCPVAAVGTDSTSEANPLRFMPQVSNVNWNVLPFNKRSNNWRIIDLMKHQTA